jgi:hypothetical protein
MKTIALGLIGIVLAFILMARLWSHLGGFTVTRLVHVRRPVYEKQLTKHVVHVEGKDIAVEVPEKTTHREVAETERQTVNVQPTLREQVWIWCMIAIAGFVLLFSVVTMTVWFYFLIRKGGGDPPAVLTEMLKYLVSSLVGIFIGFMGGTTVSAQGRSDGGTQSAPPPTEGPA